MDVSISVHGPLTAEAKHTDEPNSTNHWVQIKKTGEDGYGDITIFVSSYIFAKNIADAINAAFAKPEVEEAA